MSCAINPVEIYNFLFKYFPIEYPPLMKVPNALLIPEEKKHPAKPVPTIKKSKKICKNISTDELFSVLNLANHDFSITNVEREIIDTEYHRIDWGNDLDDDDYADPDMKAVHTYGKVISFTLNWREHNPNYHQEMKDYEHKVKNIEFQKKAYFERKRKIEEINGLNKSIVNAAMMANLPRWREAARFLAGKTETCSFLLSKKEALMKELQEIEALEKQNEKNAE